jgi:hypothetical protein
VIIRQSQLRTFLHGRIGKRLLAWLADPGNLLAALGLTLLALLASGAMLQPDQSNRQSASSRHVMVNCFWTLHDAAIADDEVPPGCGDDGDASADAAKSNRDNAAPQSATVFAAAALLGPPQLRPMQDRAGDDAWNLPER